MSLTSFLKIADVREKFRENFPMPRCSLVGNIQAPPQTNRYALVGTAFDYLMRFYLKRVYPNAITKKWVAENAISLIEDAELLNNANGIIEKTKNNYAKYLREGDISNELMANCLQLAQLDAIFRSGYIDTNLGDVDNGDIADLKNLIDIAQQQDFSSKKACVLNPTFGVASSLVGGADMDVLIDDTLIDIKTTKFLEMRREYWNQLIGYYILSKIGGIDGVTETNIEFLSIYFARHGVLYRIPVKDAIENCDLSSFMKWFIERAKQEFI